MPPRCYRIKDYGNNKLFQKLVRSATARDMWIPMDDWRFKICITSFCKDSPKIRNGQFWRNGLFFGEMAINNREYLTILKSLLQTNNIIPSSTYNIYSLSETGHGSSIRSEFAWHASGPEFDPHVRHILSCRLGHENASRAILPLIQEEQLSVTGERMCTKYW